ncbi:Sulfide-quinone reductase [Candidatus Rhodobacter oscarellae]|uniref:Sulfide-quinone reductase n=1 Tax=Candidatus Rhodobacter oscarellae TaxID=1675527 RepID=A0A0J9E4T5_9RHOB|nr:TIGR01244 family sulfur transferase [Candidatus Rhodobacter lobularis]KMW57761.1 Sulfide-quinone reductase [Candidatus Rhodobacter lobularis]
MDIRRITPDYAVSPQIAPQDMAALAAEGFTTVINNRPDAEITPDLCCDEMRRAAEAAGLRYVANPVVNGALTMQMVEAQGAAIKASTGPVFAWCRSGTRCSIVWALSEAGARPTQEILSALSQAGYDLPQLASQVDALAER